MRRVPLVAIMVGLVGGVVAASMWTVHRAGIEAMRDFRVTQARLAQDTALALHVYLDWFDRDTRVLATLTRGTREQPIDARAQDAVIRDAFTALATAVKHYRTIALFRDGPPVVAVDPTEDRTFVVPALVEASAKLATVAIASAKPASSGPVTLENGRSFYLSAAVVGDGEAVVVTADAALMLEAVSRRPSGSHGLVVVDPSGGAWLGCEQPQRCVLFRSGGAENAEIMQTIAAGRRDGIADAHPGVVRLGLPARVVVGAASPLASTLGTWSVAVVAPAADIDVRQRAFLQQLIATSFGVAMAMLTVGLFVIRQHAGAAALRARLQAAEEVARLQRQLLRAEKLVTVGVLSAGIAHDIGTPLAVVRGRAEHMLERGMAGRDAEDLRAIMSEIDRVASTISRVLDFSRDRPVEVAETAVNAAVARAVDLLGWRLVAKRIKVFVDAPHDLPTLAVSSDQLEQVVLNLLMNACDASAQGSTISVAAKLDIGRDRLRIEIVDRGAGIPPQHLNAVFDPYFTTKQRGEGTGLGLAIVSQIVRTHRGEISLRSVVGGGTVATLLWPTAKSVTASGSPHA